MGKGKCFGQVMLHIMERLMTIGWPQSRDVSIMVYINALQSNIEVKGHDPLFGPSTLTKPVDQQSEDCMKREILTLLTPLAV